MAFDKIVDSAALNSRLSGLADSIRAKGKTTEKLCFENGDYEKAVDAIRLGYFPTFQVTAPSGSNVTVTDGKTTFSGVGTGAPVAFKLPNLGTWTARAVKGSDHAERIVVVSEVKEYVTTLRFGTPVSSLPVGTTVRMKVNGKVWEWLVVHQGRPSNLYDESCNGTWLLMKYIYEERQWHSSRYNDYEHSTINSYLNGTFFGQLDANIREVVKQVRIPYRPGAGYNKTPVNSGGKGLMAHVFLLSSYEVGYGSGNASNYAPQDGARLAYFNAGSNADPKRVASLNGRAAIWWLRSPCCNPDSLNRDPFCVTSNGVWGNAGCDSPFGIRPALILSGDSIVDDSNNVE